MALYLTSGLGLLLVSVLIVLTAGFLGSVAARLLQHFETKKKRFTCLEPRTDRELWWPPNLLEREIWTDGWRGT